MCSDKALNYNCAKLSQCASKSYMQNNRFSLLKAATIRANIQFFSEWLENMSEGWPMQVVARLEICTMQINILLHINSNMSNPIIVYRHTVTSL